MGSDRRALHEPPCHRPIILNLTMSSITFRAPVPVARSNGHSRTAVRGMAPLKAISLRNASSTTKAESSEKPKVFGGLIGAAAAAALALSGPAMADVRLPPIDTDPQRCERAFTGNTIGQANAVSDRVL